MNHQQTITFIILATGGLGLFLFYLGWYRRIYDGGLYCKTCGYRVDRSGDTVSRCSECGQSLNTQTPPVNYQRKRNPYLVAIGFTLIIASALGITANTLLNFNTINWYRYLPSWYLLRTDASPENNFGNPSVQELRLRVLDDQLSENQLRKFTTLLCQRATNLHNNSTRGSMQYTGMTINLLNNYKPDNTRVNALLNALVNYFINNNQHSAGLDTKHTLWVALPLMQCDTQPPYLHRSDITSMRMRGVITSAQAITNGNPVPLLESGNKQFWFAAFNATTINENQPITLRLTINWYIEDATTPLTSQNTTQPSPPPWHTFTYECKLNPIASDYFNNPNQSTLGQTNNNTLIQQYEIITP